MPAIQNFENRFQNEFENEFRNEFNFGNDLMDNEISLANVKFNVKNKFTGEIVTINSNADYNENLIPNWVEHVKESIRARFDDSDDYSDDYSEFEDYENSEYLNPFTNQGYSRNFRVNFNPRDAYVYEDICSTIDYWIEHEINEHHIENQELIQNIIKYMSNDNSAPIDNYDYEDFGLYCECIFKEFLGINPITEISVDLLNRLNIVL